MFPKIVGFPPKSSILIGFSIIFTIHFGVPLFFGNTHVCVYSAASRCYNCMGQADWISEEEAVWDRCPDVGTGPRWEIPDGWMAGWQCLEQRLVILSRVASLGEWFMSHFPTGTFLGPREQTSDLGTVLLLVAPGSLDLCPTQTSQRLCKESQGPRLGSPSGNNVLTFLP